MLTISAMGRFGHAEQLSVQMDWNIIRNVIIIVNLLFIVFCFWVKLIRKYKTKEILNRIENILVETYMRSMTSVRCDRRKVRVCEPVAQFRWCVSQNSNFVGIPNHERLNFKERTGFC